MVAIVSGNSLGLGLTSLATLGQRGVFGAATQGQSNEQAFVNVANGNLVLQDLDDRLVSQGLDIEALRTYNSQGLLNDDNGDNWTTGAFRTGNLRYTGTLNAVGSTIIRTSQDGAEAVYAWDGASYRSAAGAGACDKIRYDSGTRIFHWTDGDTGIEERYKKIGSLDGKDVIAMQTRLDACGNPINYVYDGNYKLKTVSDASGETLTFTYSSGKLTSISTTPAAGTKTTRVLYAYDSSNRLASVTVDLSPADSAISDNYIFKTNYTYDGTSTRVASVTQGDGTKLSFTYVLVGSTYKVATVKDGLNQETRYAYESGKTTVTDALGRDTVYAYDGQGQLTSVTTAAVAGMAGVRQVTTFAYNGAGDLTSVTDPAGRTLTMEYDASGNQVLQRDAAGNTVQRTFNANNQLITEAVYVVPDADGAGSLQPAEPLVTRNVYDGTSKNLLRFAISPEGRVTEYIYNPVGQRVSVLQYSASTYPAGGLAATAAPLLGDMTAWTSGKSAQVSRLDTAYDFRGQAQSQTQWAKVDSNGAGVADGKQSVTTFVYDYTGRLQSTVSPAAGSTVYTYDGLGRVRSSTNALNESTVTTYDDAANQIKVVQANGLIITSAFDAAGRLMNVKQGSLLSTTTFKYDAANRLVMTEDPTGVRAWTLYDEAGRKVADIDGDGSLAEYVYNANNLVTHRIAYATAVNTAGMPLNPTLGSIRPNATDADQHTWQAYDKASRLVRVIDGRGAVTQTVYDGASRVIGVVRYATLLDTAALGHSSSADSAIASHPDDRISRNIYDGDGLLAATLDAEGYLTEYQYNAAGQLVRSTGYYNATDASDRATGTLADLRPTLAPGFDAVTTYLRNTRGQIAGTVDAEGYLTESVYDTSGNLTQSVRYANKVTASVSVTSTVEGVRPAANAQDQATSRVYDKLGRVSQVTDAQGTVTQYVYDNAGNLTSTIQALGTSEARTINARYDAQGRLIGELSAEGALRLTGALTQADVDAVWAQWGLTHSYDKAGRRTSTADPYGNKTLFFYNADGRLTHTVNALGEVAENQYNVLGQLAATVRYGTRINLAGLAGGLVSPALTSAIDSVRSAALDSRIAYTYSVTGALQESIDALGFKTNYVYNTFGEEKSRTQAVSTGASSTQTTTYDRRGLLRTSVADDGGIGALTSTQYDAFGRVTSTTDARGNVRTAAYDRLGRQVSTTDALQFGRSATYDAFGRVLTQTDAQNNVTRYVYDKALRSVAVTSAENITVTTVFTRLGQTLSVKDARNNTTTYSYDKDGNLKLTTRADQTTTQTAYDRANRVAETIDANGNKVSFEYDAANRLLKRTVQGEPTLTTRYEWSARGQQLMATDARGVVTKFEYDLKGQLTRQIVDYTPTLGGLNRVTEFSYDARARLLSVTAPGGLKTQYAYDKLGRRTQEVVDPVSAGNPQGLALTRSWVYDTLGNVSSATDPAGHVTSYAYDAENRLAREVGPTGAVTAYQYDGNGNLVDRIGYATVTPGAPAPNPALDAHTRMAYDKDNRLVASAIAQGVDAGGALRWAVTRQSYDSAGNVVSRTAYATLLSSQSLAADPTPAQVASWLNTVTANAALDRTERMAYDKLNRQLFRVDAQGTLTQWTCDAIGNVVQQRVYAKALQLAATVGADTLADTIAGAISTDAGDRVTRTVYDAASRAVYQIDALGAATQYTYDKAGNLTQTRRYAIALNVAALPSAPSAVSTQVVDGLLVDDATNDRIETRVYDAIGRVTAATDAKGNVSLSEYDAQGRLFKVTQPNGRISTYHYDAAGRMTSSVDTLSATESFTEHYTYDALGNKLSFRNKLGAVWTYTYDAAGRLVTETSPEVTVTSVAVDDAGNPVSTTAPARIVTRLEYDAFGNVVARTEADGLAQQRVTRYGYDAAGHQVKITFPAVQVYGAGTKTPEVFVTYDAFDQAIANRDVGGNYAYKVYDKTGQVRWDIDAKGQLTGYERNAFGDVTRLTRYAAAMGLSSYGTSGVSASAVESFVRSADHTADRTLTTQYDVLGRAIKVIEPLAYAFDQHTLGFEILSAARATETTYNALGDVLRVSVYGQNEAGARVTVAADTYYKYDILGRNTAQLAVFERNAFATTARAYLTSMAYDAAGNLTQRLEYANAVDISDASWSARAGIAYAPPATSGEDRKTLYTWRADNLKASETRVNVVYGEAGADGVRPRGDQTTRYGYDVLGNAVSSTDASGTTTYTSHDALGRVTAVTTPSVQAMRVRIAQLYVLLFNRAPEQGGMQSWFDQLKAGRDLAAVATDMFNAGIAAGMFNDGIVATIYRGALDRPSPDTAGFDHWTGKFAAAMAATSNDPDATGKVVIDFIDSVQANSGQNAAALWSQRSFNAKVAAAQAYADNASADLQAARAVTDNALREARRKIEIAQLYVAILGRAPRADELAGYLTSAQTIPQIADAIYSGGEAASRYQGATDPAQVVAWIYQNVYGQAIGDAALAAWRQVLAGGTTGEFISQLIASVTSPTTTDSAALAAQPGFNSKVTAALPADLDARTPLLASRTEFKLDIYGNVVQRVDRGAVPDEDRVTSTVYDASGHAVRSIDALGHSAQMFYDVYGRVVRQEQNVTSGGLVQTAFKSIAYDPLGRVVSVTDTVASEQTIYNAFGEVTDKKVNGATYERFEYDNAGHIWRTNAGDGVYKIALYDIAGRQTADIRSAVKDLSGYASASQVVPLGDLVRTDTRYDLLGHAIGQTRPLQYANEIGSVEGSTVNSSRILTLDAAQLQAQVTSQAQWTVVSRTEGETNATEQWGWGGTNTVNLSWTSLAGLGAGDVRAELTYIAQGDASPTTIMRDFGADVAMGGAILSWDGQPPPVSVQRVRVWKKDVEGNWALVIDRNQTGEYGNQVRIHAPADLHAKVWLQYRKAGEAAYTLAPYEALRRFGDAMFFDASALPEGNYDYQVLKQEPGQADASIWDTGSISLFSPAARQRVTELYVAIRNRAPDAAGLANYLAQYQAGTSLAAIAQQMYGTSDADSVASLYQGLSDANFVRKFYTAVLGRTDSQITPEEIGFWVGQLGGNDANRGAVLVQMVAATTGYVGLTNDIALKSQQRFNNKVEVGLAYAIDFGGFSLSDARAVLAPVTDNHDTVALGLARAQGTRLQMQVSQLYVLLYNRAPDAGGLTYWRNLLAQGASVAQVAQQMYDSGVVTGVFAANATHTEIITRIYHDALGREPDPAGLDYWVQRLSTAGVTKGQVFAEFLDMVDNYAGTDTAGLTSQRLFKYKVAVAVAYMQGDLLTAHGTLSAQEQIAAATAILAGITAAPTALETVQAMLQSARQAEIDAAAALAAALIPQAQAAQATADVLRGVPASASLNTEVAQLYTLLFNRAPDLDGLKFWAGKLAGGDSFAKVARQMYEAGQSAQFHIFPQPDTGLESTVVTQIYNRALGRAPDAAGLAYWTEQLKAANANPANDAKGNVFVQLITSVQTYGGQDAAAITSRKLFNNKVAVGLAYATLGGNSVTTAANVLGLVTASDITAAAAQVQSVIDAGRLAEIAAIAAAGTAAASAAASAANAAAIATAQARTSALAAANAATTAASTATADFRSEIVRLFVALYKRAPSLGELNSWVTTRQGTTAAAMATQMLGKPEVQASTLFPASLSATEFVTRIYQNGLGRAPDTEGLNYWVGQLATNGNSRGLVAIGILNAAAAYGGTDDLALASQQYLDGKVADYLAPLASAAGTVLTNAAIDLQTATANMNAASAAYYSPYKTSVCQLFAALIGHAPDVAGFNTWASPFALGASMATVAGSMLTGAFEASSYYGGTSNSTFVTKFYQRALGRTPDAGGLTYWTDRLNAGATRGQVVYELISSVSTYTGIDPNGQYSKSFLNANVNNGISAIANAKLVADVAYNSYAGAYAAADIASAGTSAASTAAATGATAANKALAAKAPVAAANAAAATAASTATATLRAEVVQLFTALYKRAPTLAELNGWTDLRTQGQTATQIATAMLATAEVQGLALYPASLSNQNFVKQLYKIALNNANPSSADVTWWTNRLNTASRGQVVIEFNAAVIGWAGTDSAGAAGQQYFMGRVAGFFAALAGSAASANDTAQAAALAAGAVGVGTSIVGGTGTSFTPNSSPYGQDYLRASQLYVALYGRAPTAAEATALANELHAGKSIATAATERLATAAVQALYPTSQTSAQFIDTFYRTALGRPADADALSFWTQQLQTQSRGQVVQSLFASVTNYAGTSAAGLASQALFNNNIQGALLTSMYQAAAIQEAANAEVARTEDAHDVALDVRNALTAISASGIGVGLQQGGGALIGGMTQHGIRPTIAQTVDRWGNVLSITDARNNGWVTRYTYNADNQLLDVTNAESKTSSNYYDESGRLVAQKDARGNVNTSRYDERGNLVEEVHADGAIVQYEVDAFGNRTRVREANGEVTAYTYDKLGRMLTATRAAGVGVDAYVGSGIGWDNATLDLSQTQHAELTETYQYDELGRLTATRDAAGTWTHNYYDLRGNLVTTDVGGRMRGYGWDVHNRKTSETQGDGKAETWAYDAWGRMLAHTNLSAAGQGIAHTFSYNTLGLIQSETSAAGRNLAYTYDNASGLLVKIEDKSTLAANGEEQLTQYAYDAAGNRIREKTSTLRVADHTETDVTQDNHIAYDALGRVSDIRDARYSVHYDYDENGNRIHELTRYRTQVFASPGTDTPTEVESWNAYDVMNRQTIVNGIKDASGTITIGHSEAKAQGQQIGYDGAGNRMWSRQWGTQLVRNEQGGWSNAQGEVTESYFYDAAGRLKDVWQDGVHTDARYYDKLGRVIQTGAVGLGSVSSNLLSAAGIATDTRMSAYAADGQMTYQTLKSLADGRMVHITNIYDDIGRLKTYYMNIRGDGGYMNGYEYLYRNEDASQVQTIVGFRSGDAYLRGQELGRTENGYDANGYLVHVTGPGANSTVNERHLDNDVQGRVLRKTQSVTEHNWLRGDVTTTHVINTLIANGEVIGSAGDDQSPDEATFGNSYLPVGDASLMAGPSGYAVQQGDTFQSIAKALWGDANLWYAIADANPMGSLTAGSVITIPSRPNTVLNDYQTFKPYSASAAVGDTTPVLPAPKPKSGSWIAKLLMVIVAVIVAAMTQQWYVVNYAAVPAAATTTELVVAGALAGAAGSVAGQAVGIATGVQDGFSWRGVALSAIGGGVSAGLGPLAKPDSFLETIGPVGRAVAGNVVSQGVAVVTGLQSRFDWKSVASSAAGAGVGQAVGGALGMNDPGFSKLSFAEQLGTRLVTGLAASTGAALARGGRVTVQQVGVDAFGSILGNGLVDAMAPSDSLGEFIDEKLAALDARDRYSLADMGGRLNPWTAADSTAGMPGEEFARRRLDVEDQVHLDLLGQEARDASLNAQLFTAGGPARNPPRGVGGGFEMVRNGNWDAALNIGADPYGVLPDLAGLRQDINNIGRMQVEGRINDMRQRMTEAGVKDVPTDYRRALVDGGAMVRDYGSTVDDLQSRYESFVRDRRLQETWGENYQSLRVGKSQMTVLEFEKRVLDVQQRATDRAYANGVDAIARGDITVKDGDYARALGSYIDLRVRDQLRSFAGSEGINDSMTSTLWGVNRSIRSDLTDGRGIPDNRLGYNLFADTSLARKNGYTDQIMKWNAIRPDANYLIIRPTNMPGGGSYVIPRTSIQPFNPARAVGRGL